mgnify:CR=1 FL=1
MKHIKIITILLIGILIFSGCNSPNYKFEITHSDPMKTKEIITIDDENPEIHGDKLESVCGCTTYAYNVESAIYKETIPISEKEIKNHNNIWKIGAIIGILFLIIVLLYIFEFKDVFC